MSIGATQPLQIGGALQPGKVYIERPEDRKLAELLRAGEYCNLLTPRQMGKSSLVARLVRQFRGESIACVFFDVGAVLGSHQSLQAWYRGLVKQIADELDLATNAGRWWDEQTDEALNPRLRRFFKEVVAAEIQQPIVCFLDEIDATLERPFTEAFFKLIRAMYNDRALEPVFKRISFCLIGVAAPNELIRSHRSTAYNVGRTIELGDFNPAQHDLSPLYQAMGPDLLTAQALVDRVIHWTGGQPFLTNKICNELLEQQGSEALDKEQVDVYIEQAFGSFDQVANESHFQQVQRFVNERVKQPNAVLDLYARVLKGETVRDESAPAHIRLKLAGLVKRNDQGQLSVRSPIYARIFDRGWITATKPQRMLLYLRVIAGLGGLVLLGALLWFGYDQFVLKPEREDAKAVADLEKQMLELSINHTEKARKIQAILSGKESHPILDRPLIGYENQAERAWRLFQARLSAGNSNKWLAALNNTSSEADAQRFFAILTGNEPDPDIGHKLTGQAAKAVPAYQKFWQRRAEQLLVRAEQRLKDGDIDRALILAAAAAVKYPESLRDDFRQASKKQGYEALQATARHNMAGFITIATSRSGLIALENKLYQIETGQPVKEFDLQKAGIKNPLAVAFSPDDRYLAMGGTRSNRIALWNLENDEVESWYNGDADFFYSINFSPDGKRLIAASDESVTPVVVWELTEPEPTQSLTIKLARKDAQDAKFSPDGNQIAVAAWREGLVVYDANNGRRIGNRFNLVSTSMEVAYSNDGKQLAVASWTPDAADVFDKNTQKHLHRLPHDNDVNSIAFSPDDRLIATAGDNTAKLWDANTGNLLATIQAHTDEVMHCDFSKDGRFLVTASEDGTLRIWRVADLLATNAKAEPKPQNPYERWQAWQTKFAYSLDENDEVVPLWPEGPREIQGWDPGIPARFGIEP